MALIICPECTGTISDKAYFCPHCGYPLQQTTIPPKAPRKARRRRPNGSGTIVKLSGKRKKPYQVRVNTRIDSFGMPVFDVLGNYPDRMAAEIVLAEYNKEPYDVGNRKKTFSEVFATWYQWKFQKPYDAKDKKTSSQSCTLAAYKKCEILHDQIMWDIRAQDMQAILDNPALSHSMLEHIRNLFRQMYQYALQFEHVAKDYSAFTKINKEEDDKQGVPFTENELQLLWQHKDVPFVDTILIYCYSGFRINELAQMPLDDIDLTEGTFTGGLKNRYSRNRVVPIHSDIYDMVLRRCNKQFNSLIYHDETQVISERTYRQHFNYALQACGIHSDHTPHDCRHTFNTLLDAAGVDQVTRYKLMGHKGKDINENVYTHKNLDQLRQAVEKIQIKP